MTTLILLIIVISIAALVVVLVFRFRSGHMIAKYKRDMQDLQNNSEINEKKARLESEISRLREIKYSGATGGFVKSASFTLEHFGERYKKDMMECIEALKQSIEKIKGELKQ